MRIVAYLDNENTPFYRLVLDVLLEEERALGLHLPTAEIGRRLQQKIDQIDPDISPPPVEQLLTQLHTWENVDRIQNTHRKGTYQEYLKKDYLYQLTPAGAEVHAMLGRIDTELGSAGALQASMLPEVLQSLRELVSLLNSTSGDSAANSDAEAHSRALYASLQRITNGFTQLSENAKMFVQGLNRAVELNTELDTEVFLAYKDVVVEYLQTFVMALVRYTSPISEAIDQAERAGLRLRLYRLALVEAAPVIGMSQSEVVQRDLEDLRSQWDGLRGWFFGEADRAPVAQILQDRAADAVNRIVAIVRRLNDQRFRRVNRASDLLTLATWFASTSNEVERAKLWRAAFGMYSARHLGTAHRASSDLDVRPKTSWWETPPAPVEARLRKQGPRAATGRPARVGDPRTAKQRLAALQAAEQAVNDAAVRTFTELSLFRVEELPVLSEKQLEILLRCLSVALAASPDKQKARHGRTTDGLLHITVRPAEQDPHGRPASAVLQTECGALAMENFELTITDLRRGSR